MSSTFHQSAKLRLFVFALASIAVIIIGDRLLILANSEKVPAAIIGCDSKWVEVTDTNASFGNRTREQVQYYPIAETDNGIKVVGSVMMPTRQICGNLVGTKVDVLVGGEDSKNNRIFTFIQFWALPLIGLALPVFIIASIFSRKKVKWVALFYIIGFMVAVNNELDLLDKPMVVLTDSDSKSVLDKAKQKSKKNLDRCVWAAMQKQKVAQRSELKELLCQDQDISDLSSIADLVQLKALYLQYNELTSLESLPYLSELTIISVAGIKTLLTTKGIENAPNLVEFQGNKSSLQDLKGMDGLTQLKIVAAIQNTISDITPLSAINTLEEVSLSYNQITNITALTNKPHLLELTVYDNPITDISPIFSNQNLTVFGFSNKAFSQCEQVGTLTALLSEEAKIYAPKQCQRLEN